MNTSMKHFNNEEFLATLQAASKKISELAGQLDQQLADGAKRLTASMATAGLLTEELGRSRLALPGDWPPHQKRVIEEKGELDDRLEKLDAFLETATFAQLDDGEQGRMHAQRAAMADYSRVLGERIEAFVQREEA